MPSRIIYLPIEPYQSRYTEYNSVKDGTYETEFKRLNIPFLAIRPDNNLRMIKQGQVLDVNGRTQWGFNQHSWLIEKICAGEIDPENDVIFYEDFWTPGFEQLMYACSSKFGPSHRDHPKVYSFCHAQTLDRYDFTHKWAWWMRGLEKVWWDYQHRIFCAAKEMITPAAAAGFRIFDGQVYKLNPVGHAFNKEVMLRKAYGAHGHYKIPWEQRNKQVVFAARFDAEKNPNFFLDLVEEVNIERPDISFVICTGQPELPQNEYTERVWALQAKGINILIAKHLTKYNYYNFLNSSKVMFNCAFQDWISYTVLDAAINGCAPLYPEWLTFPDVLENDPRFLYENLNLKDAKKKLYALIDSEEIPDLQFIYKKYEDSVKRMCRLMGFRV